MKESKTYVKGCVKAYTTHQAIWVAGEILVALQEILICLDLGSCQEKHGITHRYWYAIILLPCHTVEFQSLGVF
jgi:hypothetical protein